LSSKKRLLSYVFFVTGISLLIGVVLYYFYIRPTTGTDQAESIPRTIAGLALAQVITGQEAVDAIHQLHGKDFPLTNGAVASYGAQNATLWVSGTGGESDAAALTEMMKVRIAEGRSPFVDQGSFNLDGFTIYALDGLGQAHYYWQSGSLVLWLTVDQELASSALQETIHFYRPK